jgi:hypothetical protein
MKVVRHERVRMNLQLMLDRRIAETSQEEGVVLRGAKDVAAVVTPVQYVLR